MRDLEQATRKGALQGLKIVDITTAILGPAATQILGDMGAEVVKIEPPEGDQMRNLGPSRYRGMAVWRRCSSE